MSDVPIPNGEVNYFKKGEIVWAKLKFFPPWPAEVTADFTTPIKEYKNKKPLPPK